MIIFFFQDLSKISLFLNKTEFLWFIKNKIIKTQNVKIIMNERRKFVLYSNKIKRIILKCIKTSNLCTEQWVYFSSGGKKILFQKILSKI